MRCFLVLSASLCLLVAAGWLAAIPDSVSAHKDPPGQPMIRVKVEVIWVQTDQDNEGWSDHEIEVDWVVDHKGGHGVESDTDHRIIDNYYPTGWAPTDVGKRLIYEHVECSPMATVEVDISLEEDDTPGWDDELGSTPTLVFTSPGSKDGGTKTSEGGTPGADGTGRVTVRVSTEEVPDSFLRLCGFTTVSVGGTAEFLAGGSDTPTSASDGSGGSFPYAAVAAAAALVAAGGWYARRRWLG